MTRTFSTPTDKFIKSVTSEGKKKVKNIYWDNDTKELVFEIED